MVEISNTTLAVLVFVALVTVTTATVITVNNASVYGGLTGFAVNDTGTVNLTIASALNIQVDTNNQTINFGTCTPRGASSYWCASNDTQICDGIALTNCSGDTVSPQYIRVVNVGNINASVNVTSSCSAATLIGGTGSLLTFMTTSCNGTNVTSWTTLDSTTALACPNIVPATGAFQLYVNVTIPNDATGASGGCVGGVSTLTFTAS